MSSKVLDSVIYLVKSENKIRKKRPKEEGTTHHRQTKNESSYK